MSGTGIHSSGKEITLTERTNSGECLEDNASGPQEELDLVPANFKLLDEQMVRFLRDMYYSRSLTHPPYGISDR